MAMAEPTSGNGMWIARGGLISRLITELVVWTSRMQTMFPFPRSLQVKSNPARRFYRPDSSVGRAFDSESKGHGFEFHSGHDIITTWMHARTWYHNWWPVLFDGMGINAGVVQKQNSVLVKHRRWSVTSHRLISRVNAWQMSTCMIVIWLKSITGCRKVVFRLFWVQEVAGSIPAIPTWIHRNHSDFIMYALNAAHCMKVWQSAGSGVFNPDDMSAL